MLKKLLALCLLLAMLCPAALAEEATDGTVWSYASDTLTIEVTEHRTKDGSHPLVYYIADIQATSPEQMKAAFSEDAFGKSHSEDVPSIAARNGAAIAINGDYYNHKNIGIIIRNGELYRDKTSERDLLYVDAQGDLQIVFAADRDKKKNPDPITGEALAAEGVLHSFEFGPALIVNGEAVPMPKKYIIYTNERTYEPRTVIGQIGPLHYLMVVVDGRRAKWSDRGLTLQKLQDLLLSYGCQTAYNLDGGGSSTIALEGEMLNHPAGSRPRQVSDIIYFAD